MKKLASELGPLILTVALLSALSHLWAGPEAIAWISLNRIQAVIWFATLFVIFYAFTTIIESGVRAREFAADDSGQVDIHALWRSLLRNPLTGITSAMLLGYGVTASSNLVEIYRTNVSIWYDELLWKAEEPLFRALIGSWLDVPAVWDHIYFMIWPYLFLAFALVFRTTNTQRFILLTMACVISFYFTGVICLIFPTAGPAFYRPELFHLAGTASGEGQEMLRQYMAGEILQNGVIPGTRAMPSLHVGLTGMVAWFVARENPWTSWLLVPWLLLTWLSTVMLGWHYALDGPGGLVVAWASVGIARFIQVFWQRSTARLMGKN
jgi:membrane-associated phospholipid phosphatase